MITPEEAEKNPQEYLGRDIQLVNNDVEFSNSNDFAFATFRSNILQAIKNRLLTSIGELKEHTKYGSDLPDLINQKRIADSSNLIRRAIRTALLQDPRIEEVINVSVFLEKNIYRVNIQLKVIKNDNNLNLIFNLFA